MPDIVKKYLEKIKEFWNKYDRKQRIIFVSSLSVVIIALAILTVVLSRPVTTIIKYCTTAAEAMEVRELLASNEITATVNDDYSISVNEKDELEARLVLGSNNISSAGYTLDDALSGGFSVTESDKEKTYQLYLENKFEKQLEKMDGIKSADVTVYFMDTGSTIFTENVDAYINAALETTKDLSDETIEGIALLLANNVGSNNTNNVVVMDTSGNLLYKGENNSSSISTASTVYKYELQLEENMRKKVTESIKATNLYTDIQVTPSLALDNDKVTEIIQEYNAPNNTEQGLPSSTYEVDSSGNTSAGGVPGTESNDDDTGYLVEDGTANGTEYSMNQTDWLQNSTYTTREKAAGSVIYADSKISLVCVKYDYVTEEELEERGELEEISYEEYKRQNEEPVRIEVDDELITLVSNSTNIPRENISFMAYRQNKFIDTEEKETPVSFYIQIILAVVIALLLLYVVFRSARPVTVTETEPELSVEDMLASTREQQAPLEDIDLQDKSEARKAIEKFVQENPEAVALLLRNWLNEGWN